MKAIAYMLTALMLLSAFSGCMGEKEKETNPPVVPKVESNVLAAFEYKMADEGLVVDASASKDKNGLSLRYIWEWGDGSKGWGVKTYHSYDEDGTYTVSLRADNGVGDIGFANITIDSKDPSLAGTCNATGGAALNGTGNKTDKWAIIDGMSDYPGTGSDLSDCHIDALNVYDYLINNCSFPEENVFLFLNYTACPKNIKAAIAFVINHTTEASEFVYYHSGHGGAVELSGETGVVESAIYVTNDGWSDAYGITTSEFKGLFANLKSKKFAFIADSCQTGEMGGIGDSKTVPLTEGIAAPGRIIITASNEATVASGTGNGGVFTIAFLTEGIREGKGDGCSMAEPPALAGTLNTKDGKVSLQEAYWYTWWTLETGGGASPTGPEHMPEMTDNYGEPFFL